LCQIELSDLFILGIAKVARLVALLEHLCYNVAAQGDEGVEAGSVCLVGLDQQSRGGNGVAATKSAAPCERHRVSK
jgi:hypothetical protein